MAQWSYDLSQWPETPWRRKVAASALAVYGVLNVVALAGVFADRGGWLLVPLFAGQALLSFLWAAKLRRPVRPGAEPTWQG